MHDTYQQVQRATSELQQSGRATPTDQDLADQLGITVNLVAQARGVGSLFTAAPLDTIGYTRSGVRRVEPSAPDLVEGLATGVSVRAAVATLPGKDQLLLQLRFGQKLTQAQIGPVLRISHFRHRAGVQAGIWEWGSGGSAESVGVVPARDVPW